MSDTKFERLTADAPVDESTKARLLEDDEVANMSAAELEDEEGDD